ncbi:rCG54824 [Rattus norvegicus]|uniref:RCG54824 n=1 Tax=Rattus norvegicus TaxID=10116 RepID=A6IJB4_RAT|nr:rCG54824 [Rattus norvegicus]
MASLRPPTSKANPVCEQGKTPSLRDPRSPRTLLWGPEGHSGVREGKAGHLEFGDWSLGRSCLSMWRQDRHPHCTRSCSSSLCCTRMELSVVPAC